MRWKAFHYLNTVTTADKETFGFKTKNCPPVVEEMKGFEEGMIRIIQNIVFKKTHSQFQQELKGDIASVKNDDRLFVKADKTTNFYKLDIPNYKRLLEANITKTYKKADKKQQSMMDEEARVITKQLNIDDRVEKTAMKEAFITLKDHKENFANRPTCRLINPSKPEIGRISKQLLEEINGKLVNIKKVNQWKNTASVLQWFDRLTNKSDLAFICFDVVELYPSISEALLNRALDFVSEHLDISASERQTIINSKHAKQKTSLIKLFQTTRLNYFLEVSNLYQLLLFPVLINPC